MIVLAMGSHLLQDCACHRLSLAILLLSLSPVLLSYYDAIGVGARAIAILKLFPQYLYWAIDVIIRDLSSESGPARIEMVTTPAPAPSLQAPIIIVVGNNSADFATTLTDLGLASPVQSAAWGFRNFWLFPPVLPGLLLVW